MQLIRNQVRLTWVHNGHEVQSRRVDGNYHPGGKSFQPFFMEHIPGDEVCLAFQCSAKMY
jgi:hypothetical protein